MGSIEGPAPIRTSTPITPDSLGTALPG